MGKTTLIEKQTDSKKMNGIMNLSSNDMSQSVEERLRRVSYVKPEMAARPKVFSVRRRSKYSQPIMDTDLFISTYEEYSQPSSQQMAQMIIVSNRLPFVLKRDEENEKMVRAASAGGLVTGRWFLIFLLEVDSLTFLILENENITCIMNIYTYTGWKLISFH